MQPTAVLLVALSLAADPRRTPGNTSRSPSWTSRPAAACRSSNCATVNGIRLLDRQQRRGRVLRAGADEPERLLPRQQPRIRIPEGRLRLPRQGAGGEGGRRRDAENQAGQHRRAALPRHRRRHLRATAYSSADKAPLEAAGCSTGRCSARTASSTPCTAARSTGSGATPTGPRIRWATSTCPGRRRGCRQGRRTRPGGRRRPDLLRRTTRGSPKETARLPGDGPTWLNGLVVLRDGKGERLFAGYMKIEAAPRRLRTRPGRVGRRQEGVQESGRLRLEGAGCIRRAIRSCTPSGASNTSISPTRFRWCACGPTRRRWPARQLRGVHLSEGRQHAGRGRDRARRRPLRYGLEEADAAADAGPELAKLGRGRNG